MSLAKMQAGYFWKGCANKFLNFIFSRLLASPFHLTVIIYQFNQPR
jgi:hypothetical protein